MLAPMTKIRVLSDPGVPPNSDDGRALFAKLLGGGATVDNLQYFPHSTPPGHATDRHVHTADVAACVVRGTMDLTEGPGYDEAARVTAGDYVVIPQGLAHQESVIGEEEVIFVVAHRHGFHTLTAD